MLRPELVRFPLQSRRFPPPCHLIVQVRSNPRALSSDAFSLFGRPEGPVNNKEVREAHGRIFNQLIPALKPEELLSEDISVRNVLNDVKFHG